MSDRLAGIDAAHEAAVLELHRAELAYYCRGQDCIAEWCAMQIQELQAERLKLWRLP